MKMIPIVATQYLPLIEKRGMFMCLAHLIDVDMEYTEFYARRAKEGKYVIMDNGACENDLRPIEELIEKVKHYGFSELIIPDFFDDAYGTAQLFDAYYDRLRRELPDVKLMVVSHGDTKEQHRNIMYYISKGVDVIGLPKVMSINFFMKDARYIMARFIRNQSYGTDIHFLGCNHGLVEILDAERYGEGIVRSVDSALPFILAKEGKFITKQRGEGKITFKETLHEVDHLILSLNLKIWSE